MEEQRNFVQSLGPETVFDSNGIEGVEVLKASAGASYSFKRGKTTSVKKTTSEKIHDDEQLDEAFTTAAEQTLQKPKSKAEAVTEDELARRMDQLFRAQSSGHTAPPMQSRHCGDRGGASVVSVATAPTKIRSAPAPQIPISEAASDHEEGASPQTSPRLVAPAPSVQSYIEPSTFFSFLCDGGCVGGSS